MYRACVVTLVLAGSLWNQMVAADDDSGGETSSTKTSYSYDPKHPYGPSRWGKTWPGCLGNSQSPINIKTSRAVINPGMNIYYRSVPSLLQGTLLNNGHVVEFKLGLNTFKPILTGIPHLEADDFLLEQLHLHFHSNRSSGSEHSKNGQHFAGEFHLVHYNKKYGSLSNAVSKLDGLAVVGVFVQESGLASPASVAGLAELAEHIQATGSSHAYTINLSHFLPSSKHFYTYSGSLTTPTCDESVTWVVMDTPISVTESDMTLIRGLTDSHGDPIALHGNCRPQSDLGARELEANFTP